MWKRIISTKHLTVVLLVLIFLISLFLRAYNLNVNAPSLYIDETGGHYLASMRIMETQGGIFQLLYQKIFWIFSTFTWILGLNPLGVRLWTAIYGSLIVVLIFIYTKRVEIKSVSIKVPLLASILTIFLPWNYVLSRFGHPFVLIMVICTILHLYLYLKANTLKGYLFSLIPLGLATYSYPSMVVITPIAVAFELSGQYLGFMRKHIKTFLIILSISSVFVIFTLFTRFNGVGLASRGMDLAIWNDINTTWETDKFRGLTWLSTPDLFSFYLPAENLSAKLVYNTATANITVFAKNYLSFFSLDFLFLKGDQILRHSTGQVGAFLPFLLPFMIYGAFVFFRDQTAKNKQLFLIWILISPIPAAITKDGAGYLLRAITMMPFLTYFCALGIVESFTLINKRFRLVYGFLLTVVGLYSAYYFLFGYFHVYPALSAKAYEYGFKELSDFQQVKNGETMLVIWDGYYPNLHFRFWQKTPFDEYQSFTPTDTVIGDSHFHRMYPNLYFSMPFRSSELSEFLKTYKPKYLVYPEEFILKNPEYRKLVGEPVETVLYPDTTPDFYIYDLTNAK